VDQPAHGYSDGARANVVDFACILFAVAARLGPPAGLVGHSLGGLAAALALREGFAASRVVLVAPATSIKEMLRERARMFGFPDSLRRELTGHFERETGEKLERLDLRSCAPDIATPALFICDEEDAECDWTQVRRAAMSWRYSRLMTTRGLGHRRILADPNVVREGVRWLTTQKAAA
jgi:pimeloyl-ACP methyl ester carboxylesterase